MVDKNCEWCKRIHSVREADLKRGWGRFCDKSCKAKAQEARTGQNKAYHAGKVKLIPSNLPATVSTGTDLANGWKWKGKGDGAFISPCQMVTRHLFYTLRMIWNHSMPADAMVGKNIQLYSFKPFYTEKYMKEAIAHIGTELLTRTDIIPAWERELKQMQDYLARPKRIAGKVAKSQPEHKYHTSRGSAADHLLRMLDAKRIFMVMQDDDGNQYIDEDDDGYHDDYMYDGDGWGAKDD